MGRCRNDAQEREKERWTKRYKKTKRGGGRREAEMEKEEGIKWLTFPTLFSPPHLEMAQ